MQPRAIENTGTGRKSGTETGGGRDGGAGGPPRETEKRGPMTVEIAMFGAAAIAVAPRLGLSAAAA